MFPLRTILAAVDFSEPSRLALTCAARLAKQAHAQLHVLHVLDPLLAAAAHSAGIDLTRETRAELGAFALRAVPAGDWAPGHHVVTGAAVDAICNIAGRESADLVVVGARGMSGFRLPLFGSTTEGVLRRAETSVLVVPESWMPPRPDLNDLTGTGPIVVGLELTPSAIEAARAAGELARLLDTRVEILHVVPRTPVLSRWSAHAEAALQQRMQDAQNEITSALHYFEGSASAEVRVEAGSVAECLAQAVKAEGDRHPLLVLGRRTAGERGGAPGSTAYRVLGLANAPVLMCLPPH
jgi:nucleotide-binding universal stress UspA family protein